MCIRDRAVVVGAVCCQRGQAVRVVVGTHQVIRRGLRRRICLLYTSDAADERSSVDLGGRRIIKKKKRKRVGGSDSCKNENTRDEEELESEAKS